ncbi:HET-domain-containing protein [Byssothecium circinans]|uniref:HET-domain-containing protein n=1 Tax=Byssothecium circinans TaxID=147558 RepID=A0A6A5THP2_9PLEO|nr:HET-domain-containing protein [Byssothecium circinans]
MPLTTTTLNVDRWLDRIPWTELPKTFQEAINIVRLLGERYLWIDSLCIIQNDEIDWEEQSIQMATIYQNAYLTLAASKATDCTGGLHNSSNRYQETILQSQGEDGQALSAIARRHIPHFYHGFAQPCLLTTWQSADSIGQFPLLLRAWVLQERLLSPRILHFGPAELLWECCEHFTCECRDGLDNQQPEYYPKYQYSRSLLTTSADFRSAIWRNIVEAYSRLSITKIEDRLPALQGIACQLFDDWTPSKVLSGLWEATLLRDLLWINSKIYYDLVEGNFTERASAEDDHTSASQNDSRTIIFADWDWSEDDKKIQSGTTVFCVLFGTTETQNGEMGYWSHSRLQADPTKEAVLPVFQMPAGSKENINPENEGVLKFVREMMIEKERIKKVGDAFKMRMEKQIVALEGRDLNSGALTSA